MKRSMILVALTSILLVLGACQNESSSPVQPERSDLFTGIELSELGSGETGPHFDPTPDWILESLEYEEFHGTIYPGLGGFLLGHMSTWSGGSSFSIQVPPGALAGAPGDPPVPFSIRVPTRQSYYDWQHLNDNNGLPLTLVMEPSNLVFQVPVIVTATYMTWVGASTDWNWNVWTLDPGVLGYDMSVTAVKRSVQLTFEAPHFSRWQGGGGPPDK